MSGTERRMISPLVWVTKSITPWVDGCCGPKLMTISSSDGLDAPKDSPFDWLSHWATPSSPGPEPWPWPGPWSWPQAAAAAMALRFSSFDLLTQPHQRVRPRVADPVVPARLLIVLAQRMADPVVGQQDAPQVRVADEIHPQHVVDFAFQPIGRLPHSLHRRHGRLAAIGFDFEHDLMPVLQRKQVIHDLDQVARRPVDAGDVLAIVEIQPRLGLCKLANLDDLVGLHGHEADRSSPHSVRPRRRRTGP